MKKLTFIIMLFSLTSCYNQETLVDKTKLLHVDYRLFQSTPAWALAKAVQKGDTVAIKNEVIQKKIAVDYLEPLYGHTLLMFAIYHDQYDAAKVLLELGANPNTHETFDGTTAVIYAARNSDPKYLKMVLAFKGDPNSKEFDPTGIMNPTRDNALTAAVSGSDEDKSIEKVKLLLESGADINYSNGEVTNSVLAQSIVKNKLNVTIYLLQKGADYKKSMNYGGEVSILYLLRNSLLDLDSDEYKNKMKIINFLKSNGLDYDKEPIPEGTLMRMKNKYPNSWQEYMEKY